MIFSLYIILEMVNMVISVDPIDSATLTIREHGYPAESHTVVTEDGYMLTVHRIPYSIKNNTEHISKKIPVLLVHGLGTLSDCFLVLGPDKSIAYLLSDAGYDVWLGNVRGTTHSRRHLWLNPDTNNTYWDFSWHEFGIHDLPSMVDYILNHTGNKKLHLIGHSQGTTISFVMLSEKPSYNAKIISYSAFAPSAFLGHISLPFVKPLTYIAELIEVMAKRFGIYEVILPRVNVLLQELGGKICGSTRMLRDICLSLIGFFNGSHTDQIELELVPALMSTVPGGSSLKQVIHFAQIMRSGDFTQYDYKLLGNILRYKQAIPPSYDLDKITAPVGLFYGLNDLITPAVDVERLSSKLKSVTLKYLIPDKSFSHIDFLVAKNVKTVLYDKTIEFMKKSEEKIRMSMTMD